MTKSSAASAVRPRTVLIWMLAIVLLASVAVAASLLWGSGSGQVSLVDPSADGDVAITFAGVFPLEDEDALENPLGVAFDGTNLYVAESDAGTVRVFDAEGGDLGAIALPIAEGQRSVYPSAIAVADEHLIVVDNAANRVLLVGLEADAPASMTSSLGDRGTSPMQPTAVAYADGRIFVADAGDGTVKIYSEDGTYLQALAPEALAGERAVTALAIGGDALFAAGASSGRVHVFDIATGEVVTEGFGPFAMARTLEPVGGGMLAVVDGLDRSISLCDMIGAECAVIDSDSVPGVRLSSPRGAAWAEDGERLYVTDAGSGRVFVYNIRLELL